MNNTIELPNAVTEARTTANSSFVSTKLGLMYAVASAAAFHVAWFIPAAASLTIAYAYFLIRTAEHPSLRVAFRLGFLNGLLVFAPHLSWFWNIFGIAAVCLWAVLAFFSGAFVLLIQRWRIRFGTRALWIAAAVSWTGLEFFRSEIYFLKFSWLSVGYAFTGTAGVLPVGFLGVYGTGFMVFLIAGLLVKYSRGLRSLAALIASFGLLANIPGFNLVPPMPGPTIRIAGIQLEFPAALEIPAFLDRVLSEHPDAELFVLSEYTFDSTIPQRVLDWCKQNEKFLIAGGKDESVPEDFYNTAFVAGPSGEIIFEQAKSVPIQFFKDGLPAASQKVWNSPWGRIAIPVCYDLSYRKVTDAFIRDGAQAFVVPFMDVTHWGAYQHKLHARVAPMRALEHNTPIFRLGSSGISQNVDAAGAVQASADYPGQETIFAGTLAMSSDPRIPLDRWLAPLCSNVTGVFALLLIVLSTRNRFKAS